MRHYLILFVLLLGVGALSAGALEYDIYIAAGQSNMDGRGAVRDLEGKLAQPQAGVAIYYTNPADPKRKNDRDVRSGWQTLAPGFSIPPNKRPDGLPAITFGPEVAFAKAMSEAEGATRPIAIIKVSRGGTNLRSDWSPTGFMYQALLAEIDAAMLALEEQGHSGTIRGMLWHQGESDASDPAAYRPRLEQLIANVREKVNNPTLPFLIGELSHDKPEDFRAMQREIAEANEDVYLVSAEGLATPDGTHFDADSQIAFGQRFAEVLLGPAAEQE